MQALKTDNETNTKDALIVFNCIFNSQYKSCVKQQSRKKRK